MFEKNYQISNNYDFIQELGRGAYGVVYKALNKKTGMTRAIKKIDKNLMNADEISQLVEEVDILKHIDHPNIIKIYEFYQTSKFFYIVTEFCFGG